MELGTDEDEHSIEMHLPYIRKVFEGKDISIVPILVGAIDKKKEETLGVEDTFFVISSDFCHWGARFSYTFYFSQSPSGLPPQSGFLAMELITLPPSTAHQAHNTICGRHPIGEHAKSPHLQWVKYEQSSRCLTIKDSSVSYASAYVTV
ncbi:MEMO1 family [Lactarius quietus]|nr:MEMO1 family [Lactarius quietus]